MDNKDMGFLIMGFIAIFVSVVLLATLGDSVNENVNLYTFTNETVAFTALTTGQLDNDRVVSASFVGWSNETHDMTPGLTNGSINVSSTGLVTIAKELNNQSMNFTGNYGGTNYVQHATSRTITGLIPLFFAIGILLLGVGFVFTGLKGTGIL